MLALVFSVGYLSPIPVGSTLTSTVLNADLCLLAFYLDLPVGMVRCGTISYCKRLGLSRRRSLTDSRPSPVIAERATLVAALVATLVEDEPLTHEYTSFFLSLLPKFACYVGRLHNGTQGHDVGPWPGRGDYPTRSRKVTSHTCSRLRPLAPSRRK